MNKKLLWLIPALLAIVLLAYFGYPIIKNRYFSQDENATSTENNGTKNEIKTNIVTEPPANNSVRENSTVNEEGDEDIVEETRPSTGIQPSGDISLVITEEDCQNQCADFETEAYVAYCQKVCAASTAKQENSECSEFQGTGKDYCFKDLALLKKDYKYCDKISDATIKKSCEKRVMEQILDESTGLEE